MQSIAGTIMAQPEGFEPSKAELEAPLASIATAAIWRARKESNPHPPDP